MLDKQVSAVILQILEKHGYDLITQPEKMEALLKDIMPGKHKETLMIILSIKEDIPNKIKSLINQDQIDLIPLNKIETLLVENLLIQKEAASWIIALWREVFQQKQTKQNLKSSQRINEIENKIEEKQIEIASRDEDYSKSTENAYEDINTQNNPQNNVQKSYNNIKEIIIKKRKTFEIILIWLLNIIGIGLSIFGISYLLFVHPQEASVTYPVKYEKIHFSLIPRNENQSVNLAYLSIDGKEKTISTPGSKYYIADNEIIIDLKNTSNIRSIVINQVSLDEIDIANFNKPKIRYIVNKENENICIYEEISSDNKRFVAQIPLQ